MKIFKNCPEERKGRKECVGCPRIKHCGMKKININDKIKVTKKGKIKITKNGYFFDTKIIV